MSRSERILSQSQRQLVLESKAVNINDNKETARVQTRRRSQSPLQISDITPLDVSHRRIKYKPSPNPHASVIEDSDRSFHLQLKRKPTSARALTLDSDTEDEDVRKSKKASMHKPKLPIETIDEEHDDSVLSTAHTYTADDVSVATSPRRRRQSTVPSLEASLPFVSSGPSDTHIDRETVNTTVSSLRRSPRLVRSQPRLAVVEDLDLNDDDKIQDKPKSKPTPSRSRKAVAEDSAETDSSIKVNVTSRALKLTPRKRKTVSHCEDDEPLQSRSKSPSLSLTVAAEFNEVEINQAPTKTYHSSPIPSRNKRQSRLRSDSPNQKVQLPSSPSRTNSLVLEEDDFRPLPSLSPFVREEEEEEEEEDKEDSLVPHALFSDMSVDLDHSSSSQVKRLSFGDDSLTADQGTSVNDSVEAADFLNQSATSDINFSAVSEADFVDINTSNTTSHTPSTAEKLVARWHALSLGQYSPSLAETSPFAPCIADCAFYDNEARLYRPPFKRRHNKHVSFANVSICEFPLWPDWGKVPCDDSEAYSIGLSPIPTKAMLHTVDSWEQWKITRGPLDAHGVPESDRRTAWYDAFLAGKSLLKAMNTSASPVSSPVSSPNSKVCEGEIDGLPIVNGRVQVMGINGTVQGNTIVYDEYDPSTPPPPHSRMRLILQDILQHVTQDEVGNVLPYVFEHFSDRSDLNAVRRRRRQVGCHCHTSGGCASSECECALNGVNCTSDACDCSVSSCTNEHGRYEFDELKVLNFSHKVIKSANKYILMHRIWASTRDGTCALTAEEEEEEEPCEYGIPPIRGDAIRLKLARLLPPSQNRIPAWSKIHPLPPSNLNSWNAED